VTIQNEQQKTQAPEAFAGSMAVGSVLAVPGTVRAASKALMQTGSISVCFPGFLIQ
jgi:hypothetical protein